MALWGIFHFGGTGSWRTLCPGQMLPLLGFWVRGSHCPCPYPAFHRVSYMSTSALSSLETLLPNPHYSKRLMSSRGHKHRAPQRCSHQHGREAPMSRREACPFPLLLMSNYKSASSDPVGSHVIIIGRQGLLNLLPGPAEEAFISCFPGGHRNTKSPFLFTPFLWSDAQLSLCNPGLPIQTSLSCLHNQLQLQLTKQPGCSGIFTRLNMSTETDS